MCGVEGREEGERRRERRAVIEWLNNISTALSSQHTEPHKTGVVRLCERRGEANKHVQSRIIYYCVRALYMYYVQSLTAISGTIEIHISVSVCVRVIVCVRSASWRLKSPRSHTQALAFVSGANFLQIPARQFQRDALATVRSETRSE